MKRLANLKNSSDSGSNRWSNKRHTGPKNKKDSVKNTPYPLSGIPNSGGRASRTLNSSFQESIQQDGNRPHSQSEPSLASSGHGNQPPGTGQKSAAPTVSTNGGETAVSEAAYSKAGTMATAGGAISSNCGDEGSTFSSPAPSVRSLTTTLTTVQSAAPSAQLHNAQNMHHGQQVANPAQNTGNQQVQFSHQFPPSPASAVPPHLGTQGHSNTYNSATANNALTDNASVLTLASSSKRRRRNSLDTNASVRALAPSSVFGGSRESLPLSVLSGNVGEPSNTSGLNSSGALNRPSMVGLASAERVSVYSSGAGTVSGGGERGSLHGNRQGARAEDGASVRSGAQSHGRNDSNTASPAGGVASPLTSPSINQPMGSGRISRRSSGWGEITGDENEDEGQTEERGEATEETERKKK